MSLGVNAQPDTQCMLLSQLGIAQVLELATPALLSFENLFIGVALLLLTA